MARWQDLSYYANIETGSVHVASSLPKNLKYATRRKKFEAGYVYIGTWQCNQNGPYINEKRQICRRLWGKEVVISSMDYEIEIEKINYK